METNGVVRARLLEHEWLALAGLARALIRADGRASREELDAVEDVVAAFDAADQGETWAYRQAAFPGEGRRELAREWLERAASALPDDEAIRRAAEAVERPEARVAIHEALFTIAAADVIAPGEWPILEWLATTWELDDGA